MTVTEEYTKKFRGCYFPSRDGKEKKGKSIFKKKKKADVERARGMRLGAAWTLQPSQGQAAFPQARLSCNQGLS